MFYESWSEVIKPSFFLGKNQKYLKTETTIMSKNVERVVTGFCDGCCGCVKPCGKKQD